jgi:hypothetical protein
MDGASAAFSGGQTPGAKKMNVFGYATLDSWFEWDGQAFIGMGSKTTYDRNGNITDYSAAPTGIILAFTRGDEDD